MGRRYRRCVAARIDAPVTDLAPRRARAAVAAFFMVNGVLFANLLPRYPEVRARLDLSNAVLGAAIAAMPAIGALADAIGFRSRSSSRWARGSA